MTPGQGGLSAGAVARRLGVAVTTLRSWDQRYGLGPRDRTPGRHRRYTEDDLGRLEVMRRLTAEGVPPADAARRALAGAGSAPGRAGAPPAARGGPARPPPGGARARFGGGHTIPVGRAGPAAHGLARAAMTLDGGAVRDILARAIAERGVVTAWEEVVVPVLIGVGRRFAATGRLVEVEHLLSATIAQVLAAVPRPGPGPVPRTLLANVEGEQHTLPLEAVAAALGERGVAASLLGGGPPLAALVRMVRRTAPDAVLLWSHAEDAAHSATLDAVAALRPRPTRIAAAGPGWGSSALPAGVVRPADLSEAVALLAPGPAAGPG